MPVRAREGPPEGGGENRVARLGPVVYCTEAADNDGRVTNLSLPPDGEDRAPAGPAGRRDGRQGQGQAREQAEGEPNKPVEFTAVPYHAQDHREPGEMAVWLPRTRPWRAPAKPTIANTSRALLPRQPHRHPRRPQRRRGGRAGRSAHPAVHLVAPKGTDEWVQYDFRQPTQVRRVTVKWFDDTGASGGACRSRGGWCTGTAASGNRSRRSIRTAPPRPSNRSPRRRCGWSPSSHPTGPEDPGMAGGIGGDGGFATSGGIKCLPRRPPL